MQRQLSRRSLLLGAGTLRAQTALQGDLTGNIILPGDADYESARRIFSFNPRTARRPQMILRCSAVDDAVRAVGFAR